MDSMKKQSLDLSKTNDFSFTVTGTMAILNHVPVLRAADRQIRGFRSKSGGELLPILAFEHTAKDGTKSTFLCTDQQMVKHGLSVTDYDVMHFYGEGPTDIDSGHGENPESLTSPQPSAQ